MGLAGKWFVLSMVIVAVLNLFVAFSFAELHDLMPNIEGGIGQYTKVALGPVVSIISNTSAYVMVNALALPVELAMCGMVVHELFLPWLPAPLLGVILILILGAVNYRGIHLFSRVQNISVAVLIFSMAAMGLLAFFKLGTGAVVDPGLPVVGGGFWPAVALSALAFWLFIGIEFIVPLSKDVRNPRVNVPLAMALGILLLLIVQSLLGSGMTNYVTYEALTAAELPHMLFAENLLGRAGLLWMGIISIFASISTGNTLMGAIPNILSGMAKNDMMPAVFARKNKYGIPVAGLTMITVFLVFMVGSGLTQAAGLVNTLLAASCFWLTSYMLVSLSVLVLRKRYPHHPGRNNKLTFWGLPQILCILGNIFMIWNIAEGDARVMIYKTFFIILGAMIIYALIWTGFIKKQPFFKGVEISEIIANEE
jgi:amino acid transporter